MAGLVLAGCQKRVVNNDGDDAAPVAVTATPDYAPPGVFFILASVRKETKDGILRLLPGTEVKLLRNGKYQTPEGEMALDPRNLTNDRTAAHAARLADQRGQAAALPKAVTVTAPVAPRVATRVAAPQQPATTPPVAAFNSAPAPAGSLSEEQIRAMKFKLTTLKGEEAKLQANLTYLWERMLKVPKGLRTQDAPSSLNGSTSLEGVEPLKAKLVAVRAEIQELETRLQSAAH